MDVAGTVPESIPCHSCGSRLELAGLAAFTHMECPQCGALSVVPVQFGNFLLLNTLGIGGMGTVYRAMDLSLNRYVALKILRKKLAANTEFIEDFSREARAAAAVNHPNIAQVYSFGEHNNQYYLSIELLERGSLDDRIVKLIKLPERDVLEIGAQVAAGLRAAAERNLLHRDVKPGNILFNDEGIPKIVDFGLARMHTGGTVAAQPAEAIWGTPYYIAPEKLRGQPEDFRSDMYSLGATLFHALAGRPPYDAATAGEVVAKHATQPLLSLKTFVPTVHESSARVIARMLAKNPAERFRSYDELIQEIQAALDALKAEASTRAIVAPTGERVSVASIVGSIAGLIVCAAAVWYVWSHRARIFQEAPPLPPVESPIPSPAPPGEKPASAGPVDFTAKAPWVTAWNVATLQLGQELYQKALEGYESVWRSSATPANFRQWAGYYLGLTLMADDRPGEAAFWFQQSIDPYLRESAAKPAIPQPITADNFASTLGLAMTDRLPMGELEAAGARMPHWAAALTDLSAAFWQRREGAFAAAAERFSRYRKLPPDADQKWVYLLQPLGEKMAADCGAKLQTLATIDTLEQQGQIDQALAKLRGALQESRLAPYKSNLVSRETVLKQKLEEQRQKQLQTRDVEQQRQREQEEQQRAKTGAELQKIKALGPELAPFWRRYDFQGALAQFDALASKIQTPEGRKLLDQRSALPRLLAEFKSQLAADFTRQPYSNELVTRTGTRSTGRLVRATGEDLVFATQYGELLMKWSDLSPEALVRMARYYAGVFQAAEKPPIQARRYQHLALFCQQYGLTGGAEYARQATRLMPELQTELDPFFGGDSEPKPPAAVPSL